MYATKSVFEGQICGSSLAPEDVIRSFVGNTGAAFKNSTVLYHQCNNVSCHEIVFNFDKIDDHGRLDTIFFLVRN